MDFHRRWRDRHPSSRRPGRQAGFTLIELLVVIAIIGVLVALLVPAVDRETRCKRQEAVIDGLLLIQQAQTQFRTGDADGDGVDDYGTLFELAVTSLLPSELADGSHEADLFALSRTPPPAPPWQIRADPVLRDAGTFHLFLEAGGIVRRPGRATRPTRWAASAFYPTMRRCCG